MSLREKGAITRRDMKGKREGRKRNNRKDSKKKKGKN